MQTRTRIAVSRVCRRVCIHTEKINDPQVKCTHETEAAEHSSSRSRQQVRRGRRRRWCVWVRESAGTAAAAGENERGRALCGKGDASVTEMRRERGGRNGRGWWRRPARLLPNAGRTDRDGRMRSYARCRAKCTHRGKKGARPPRPHHVSTFAMHHDAQMINMHGNHSLHRDASHK